jgi:hypothetical protein
MNYAISVTAEPFEGRIALLRPLSAVQQGPETEPETEPMMYGDAPFGGDVTVPRSLSTAKFYYELKAGLVDGTRIALVSHSCVANGCQRLPNGCQPPPTAANYCC